jgi:hypothetical protein
MFPENLGRLSRHSERERRAAGAYDGGRRKRVHGPLGQLGLNEGPHWAQPG